MKRSLLSGLIFAAVLGCNRTPESDVPVVVHDNTDSLMSQIDSIRFANLHNKFVGVHTHTPGSDGDLAKHAHQDIPTKRQFTSTLAKSIEGRRKSHKKATERKKQFKKKNND